MLVPTNARTYGIIAATIIMNLEDMNDVTFILHQLNVLLCIIPSYKVLNMVVRGISLLTTSSTAMFFVPLKGFRVIACLMHANDSVSGAIYHHSEPSRWMCRDTVVMV